MHDLHERQVQCPYCGEDIDVLLDSPAPQQVYVEDCQVCCRPINFAVSVDLDGTVSLAVTTDTE